MTSDAKKISDKFAGAFAAVANASPEAAFKAAAFIRTSAFCAENDDPTRSAINAFAHFIEQTATKRHRALQQAFGGESKP